MGLRTPARVPLAITGLGLRLPGASSLAELEQLLTTGRVAIAPLPTTRLDRELYLRPGEPTPGFTYTELGAAVPLTPSPTHAGRLPAGLEEVADPAHLTFLSAALDALADAGLDPAALSGRRVGILVGHASPSDRAADLLFGRDVHALLAALPNLPELSDLDPRQREDLAGHLARLLQDRNPWPARQARWAMSACSAARLVAAALGTQSICWAVDAACASSFAALHQAHRLVAMGRLDLAIVGGCSFSQWSSLVLFCQAGAPSATGSFPLDARADGFISADGYAALVLEPAAAAAQRGRTPLAVLRRIAGACDGRAKSLWAPAVQGQVEAISHCYDEELPPASVQVIEAHCTGTQVGDATEVQALAHVFGPVLGSRRLPIASIKGNLGHTRECAGLAGLLRLVIAIRSGLVPPAAGFELPSPAIDWGSVPFRVPVTVEPWPELAGLPRRGAVSSMGIGGLDYHAVVDGPPAAAVDVPTRAEPFEPVAVVGIGLLHPSAASLEALATAVAPSLPRYVAPGRSDPALGDGADSRRFVLAGWRFDWRRHGLPPKHVEGADPIHLMLLEVASRALEDAGWKTDSIPHRNEIAVFVGTAFGSDFSARVSSGLRAAGLARELEQALRERGASERVSRSAAAAALGRWRQEFPIVDEWGSYSPSTFASRLAKHFDLRGPCAALDADEDSSFAALLAAVTALQAGDCAAAICCAAHCSAAPAVVESLREAGWLADDVPLTLADTAVALALRRSADARRDGQRVLLEIDRIEQAYRHGDPLGALAAVGTALPDAAFVGVTAGPGLDPERERQALARGRQVGRWLALAPVLGSAQGADGLLALLAAASVARGGNDAPSQPIAAYSASFAGSASVVTARVPTRPDPPAQRARLVQSAARPRVVRLGAASPEHMEQRLRAAKSGPEGAWRDALATSRFEERDLWRLAVVADSPASLAARLALVRRVPEPPEHWPALHEQGIFLHSRPDRPPRLGVLFPGQGSQYPGMFRGLVDVSAAARNALSAFDRGLGEPSWRAMAWEPSHSSRLGSDIWLTQAAVLGADALAWAALRALGIRPDVVAGHSLGEMAALVAADAWRIEDALCLLRARIRAFACFSEPPGRLISTSLADEAATELGRRHRDRGVVALAVRNSFQQAVLAVANDLVTEVLAELSARGEAARLLPVPMPYHSRLLAPAQPAWEEAVAQVPLAPPCVPFMSWVDASYQGEPEELRRRLAAQHLQPLDFVRLVERLWSDGVRVFIEAGPRSILTRLVRSILSGRPALVLSVDNPQATAGEQLLRVQALLETQGILHAAWEGPLGVVPYTSSRVLPEPVREGVVHVDATTRRPEHRHGGEETASPPPAHRSVPEAVEPLDEVTEALLAFVCEHTGYPREFVGLDQDLEAELGIDSLRKAQMLLAARDRFGITAPVTTSGLALGQLSTLRQVAALIRELRSEVPPGTVAPPADTPHVSPAAGSATSSGPRPFAAPDRAIRRWVVRGVPLAATVASPAPGRPTLLVGTGPMVSAMAAALEAGGSRTRRCPNVVTALSVVREAPPPVRLVLATALAPEQGWFDPDAGVRRMALERHGMHVFELVRAWVGALAAAGQLAGAELVCVSALGGGAFPVPGRPLEPAGGAQWGLARALRHELPEVRIKTLDLAADEPPARAAQALLAILHDEMAVEHVWARGRDLRPGLVAAPLPSRTAPAPKLAPALAPGVAWLVTGGGRGITALAARELGRRFGVELHLLGRTSPEPLPESWAKGLAEDGQAVRTEVERQARREGRDPDAAWNDLQARIELARTLADNAAAGVRCTYHQADITDASSLGAVLARVRAAGAPLRGLLHGAGVEHGVALAAKDASRVRATLESKVLGLQHLLALTRDEPFFAVVAFGSAAALVGNHGQSDYALANGLLASLLTSYREVTGTPAATLIWTAWAGAGMATRGVARLAFEASGIALMSPSEGCEHFLQELCAGLPDPEPVFIQDPTPRLAPATLKVLSERLETPSGESAPALLDRILRDCEGNPAGGEMLLEASTHPLLRDHRLDGVPLFPAVAMLEAMAEGACGGVPPSAPMLVRDWRIHAALRVPAGCRCRARVACQQIGEESRVALHADRLNAHGTLTDADLLVSEAILSWAASAPRLPATPPCPPASDPRWRRPGEPSESDASARGSLWHGPSLRSLRYFALAERDGAALLEVAPLAALRPDRPHGVWCTAPALLDGCLVACGLFCRDVLRRLCLPVGVDELWLGPCPAPGTEASLSWTLVDERADDIEMGFVLHDKDGQPVFVCRGLHVTPMQEAAPP